MIVNTLLSELGVLNGHSTGILMKELVRRAIGVIRNQLGTFEATAKMGYSGNLDDVVTTADKAAQAVYAKSLQECFPLIGILGEEGLRVDCRIQGLDAYFTVDPLDGTKAYTRRQSDGIGTMISLVINGKIVAAFVGDVMTHEIYGYRPDSDKVHRIRDYGQSVPLVIDESLKLKDQYLLLLNDIYRHTPLIQKLAGPRKDGGLAKGTNVIGGSIGTNMARLWKGEVGAVVLHSKHATPWDVCPILGISEKLGFVFLRSTACSDKLMPTSLPVSKEVVKQEGDVLVVHKSRMSEVIWGGAGPGHLY